MGIFYPVHPVQEDAAYRRPRPRARVSRPVAFGVAHAGGVPGVLTFNHPSAAGRRRPDYRDAFGQRGPRPSGRRPRACLSGTATAPSTSASRQDDDEALKAFDCCRIEGIIPPSNPGHAIAHATRIAPTMAKDQILLVNLSGRGDKGYYAGIPWRNAPDLECE